LTDQRDFGQAFESWSTVLELVPGHAGAHQGLGFLYFRAGEFDDALAQLEEAARLAPDDPGIQRGIETVRAFAVERTTPAEVAPEEPADEGNGRAAVFGGLEGANKAVVLLDRHGRLLAGGLVRADGEDVAEQVAAFLAGVSQECERSARLLDLGVWTGLTAEAERGHVHIVPPTAETLLLLSRDRSVPLGRIAHLAERAAAAARRWLEEAE
jgi:predicted TPR repeat methyltransferase